MALRHRRQELRRDDAQAGERASGGSGGVRPGRLPHVHAPSRGGARRALGGRRLWHPPHGRLRPMLVVRVRPGDLRPGGHRVPRHVRDDRDARAPGATPGVLGTGHRATQPDPAAALAPGAGGVSGRARGRQAGGGGVRLLVAGGAGFIGSSYVRQRLRAHPDDSVRVLDKLTYAGRRENLQGLPGDQVELVEGDIADLDRVPSAVDGCDAIVNFAAESHVDRSIESPGEFIETDVFGAFVLLEAARSAGIRHLQVSTDEVYGSIESGSFTEESPIKPSSPYSASKAGGDLIVGAYHHTYGSDALIVRGSNNYGPRQHPEKLIPLCVLNALAGDPLPVYGDGLQVRNWLYVDDFAAAIDLVLERGRAGEAYNVGGPDELTNIDVVRRILELTGRDESLIEYVRDRLGHDRRYSLASDKLTDELG